MLLSGADLTIANSKGEVALHRAAQRGDPTLVQSMLEHGAFVDVRTLHLRTPLMVALLDFHLQDRAAMQRTVEVLIAADADLNAVCQGGDTALTDAMEQVVKSNNNETYSIPALVCIMLIEAGQ